MIETPIRVGDLYFCWVGRGVPIHTPPATSVKATTPRPYPSPRPTSASTTDHYNASILSGDGELAVRMVKMHCGGDTCNGM